MKVDEAFIIIPLAVFMCCFCIIILHLLYKQWRLQVDKWAKEQDIKIVKCKAVWFFHPFPKFTTSRSQYIFKALVVDKAGKEKIAWLRVGGYWLGFLAQQVECIWSDAQRNDY
jgi:hypothetical protein